MGKIIPISKFYNLLAPVLFMVGSLYGLNSQAADSRPSFEDENIVLRLSPRSPDQMAGFYEARGFPKPMVDILKGYCFLTVVIHNKSSNVMWLDLDDWEFKSGTKTVVRVSRTQWPSRWKQMGVPLAAQSTFRWTLLPELLDFRPDEHEGGNIVLVRTKEEFSLQAPFLLGADKKSGRIIAHIDNLKCAEDAK